MVSYLRTAISSILQQQGHKALLFCGISVQVGSLIAALTMFPMVSVYGVFKQSVLCQKVQLMMKMGEVYIGQGNLVNVLLLINQ